MKEYTPKFQADSLYDLRHIPSSRILEALTRPRLLQMPIADFATQEDRQYQMDKYIAKGFDYEKAHVLGLQMA